MKSTSVFTPSLKDKPKEEDINQDNDKEKEERRKHQKTT